MHKRDSHFNKMFHFKFLKCFGRCSITLGSSVYSLERWLMSLSKYIFKQFQLQKPNYEGNCQRDEGFQPTLKVPCLSKTGVNNLSKRLWVFFFNSNILQNPKGNLHSCKNLQYTWLKKIHICNCDCSEKHSERDLPNITNHKNGKDVFYFLFTEEVFPMLSPILSCPKLTKSRMLYNYHIEYEFV